MRGTEAEASQLFRQGSLSAAAVAAVEAGRVVVLPVAGSAVAVAVPVAVGVAELRGLGGVRRLPVGATADGTEVLENHKRGGEVRRRVLVSNAPSLRALGSTK